MVTVVEEVRKNYQDKATFIVLYQREIHPGVAIFKDIKQPEKYEERALLAKRTCEEVHVATTIVIDEMNNAVHTAYGGFPNSAYIIGKGGKIRFREPWAKPEGWGKILDKILSTSSKH